MQKAFQSTLPVRGATKANLLSDAIMAFQSTLPVRGATGGDYMDFDFIAISIHAPREGSDLVA